MLNYDCNKMANDDEMKTFDSCHWEFVWEKRSTNRRENLYNDLLLNGIVFYHWQWGWRLTRERSIKWWEKSNCKLWNWICKNEEKTLSIGRSLIWRSVVFSQWCVKSVEGKEKKTICSRTANQFSNRSSYVRRKPSDIPSLNRWTFSSLLQLNSYLHKYRWKEPQMTHKIVKIIWVKSKVKWKFCWVSEIEDHLCRV